MASEGIPKTKMRKDSYQCEHKEELMEEDAGHALVVRESLGEGGGAEATEM
jgi:hypothetical protein